MLSPPPPQASRQVAGKRGLTSQTEAGGVTGSGNGTGKGLDMESLRRLSGASGCRGRRLQVVLPTGRRDGASVLRAAGTMGWDDEGGFASWELAPGL